MDGHRANIDHIEDRCDLAASFRWAARMNLHEGVANHFSMAISDNGRRFLMNPNQMHFARIKASDLLLLDANDPDTLDRPVEQQPYAARRLPHNHPFLHRSLGNRYRSVAATGKPGARRPGRIYRLARGSRRR